MNVDRFHIDLLPSRLISTKFTPNPQNKISDTQIPFQIKSLINQPKTTSDRKVPSNPELTNPSDLSYRFIPTIRATCPHRPLDKQYPDPILEQKPAIYYHPVIYQPIAHLFR